MATVMAMRWEGVEPEQYDAVMAKLDLDADPPQGARLHIGGFDNGTLRVLDVWDSQQDFETMLGTRVQAAVQEVGVQGEPQIEYYEARYAWAPQGNQARDLAS